MDALLERARVAHDQEEQRQRRVLREIRGLLDELHGFQVEPAAFGEGAQPEDAIRVSLDLREALERIDVPSCLILLDEVLR